MAKVNHKLLKQRLNEKRGKITDRQFFTSRLLAGYFEDLAMAQTRRYKTNRRVRVNLYWKPDDPNVAYTDNLYIRINTGHSFVKGVKGRENRFGIVTGIFAHELGHILYTDFLAGQSHTRAIEGYHWYPTSPDLHTKEEFANEKDIWEYVRQDRMNLKAFSYVAHHVSNILEDGYIENKMLNRFSGTLGYGLTKSRERQWEEMPTLTQLIEHEDAGQCHKCESIFQLMLSYAKYGDLKYGDEALNDERVQTVFELLLDIDHALLSNAAKERLSSVNRILVHCWQYIKELCEVYKEMQKQAEAAGATGSLSETVTVMRRSMKGGSVPASGSSCPVSEKEETEEISSATSGKRKITFANASAPSEQEEADGAGESPEEESNHEDSSKDETEALEFPPQEDGEMLDASGAEYKSKKRGVSEEEGGRIPYHQSEELSEPENGTVEYDPNYERQMYDKATADIERILDRMAEKAACKEMETERLQELNEAAQSISYGDIHKGVKIVVNRIASVDEELVDQYHAIAPPLLTVSKQLQRSLLKQLKESRRGGKQTGLLMGRRLDSHALHRNDGKVFYKNALPNEIPELAVGLLLDESGSMFASDRCTYARASAIILYDFCQNLDIPVMVYGHSTGRGVELYSYAEFDSIDNDDKYRMMDIGARDSNRDGAALRFVAEQLSKRPEAVKLLILVSDGQPADWGYSGSAAEEDLRGIKQEYQRKGILFVAAAIGNDKENIERIYGDSFLDITDLTQLPVKLTNIVKRHIRV